jgi:hypothetical protein
MLVSRRCWFSRDADSADRCFSSASFLADVGHEVPTALLPNLLTATFGAPHLRDRAH